MLDLHDQPAADHFPPAHDPGPDPRWPLGLALCGGCGLVQLTHTSPAPEEPRAVESATVRAHADRLAGRLVERLGLPPGARVRELTSAHGGSWLPALGAHGLCATGGDVADVVLDNHAIIHAERTADAFAERVAALSPRGRLVVEFHHAARLLVDSQVDTVRHGHPVYLTLAAWSHLCEEHGLAVLDAWPEPVYGGCLVVVAGHAAAGVRAHPRVERALAEEERAGVRDPEHWHRLGVRSHERAAQLHAQLASSRAAGRSVLGYGAGSKAPGLLNLAGVDRDLLPATADLAPAKHGRRVPGTDVPIISPDELVARRPEEVLILLWDLADEVEQQLRAAGLRARFRSAAVPGA